MNAASPHIDPPLAMLAELTYRCPLRCPYCSNPLEMTAASGDMEFHAELVFAQELESVEQ